MTHSYHNFSCFTVSYWAFVAYITVTSQCFLHHRCIVISRSCSEMSHFLLAFLLKFNFIIHHYYTYINIFILVHLSVWICFHSLIFTDMGHICALGLCVLTYVNIVDYNDITLSQLSYHLCIHIHIFMHTYLLGRTHWQTDRHHWFKSGNIPSKLRVSRFTTTLWQSYDPQKIQLTWKEALLEQNTLQGACPCLPPTTVLRHGHPKVFSSTIFFKKFGVSTSSGRQERYVLKTNYEHPCLPISTIGCKWFCSHIKCIS